MKLLRETIRKIILEGRGMFTHQDLPANACITVKRTYSRDATLDFSGDWQASALSKKYTKEPTTINALKERWVELK